jgi:uncharacterized protein YlxW (UPF0749 family)
VTTPATRRPDASMTLLAEVMERPLDPGYAAAAERRRLTGDPPSRVLTRVTTPILLALIALLTVAAVLALRAPAPGATSAKDALLERIKTGTAAADRLQRANDKLRAENDKTQATVLALQAQSGLADQLQQLGIVSGSLAVQGPGLRITVHDAPASAPSANADPREQDADANGRVLDRDLQIVVNGLWAAGAEAISVNGQRLTALSAIRSAGQAILVDFRPLSPPYVVSAIGPTDSMRADFAAGSAGTYLHSLADNYGIDSDVASVSKLSLPASSGLTLHDVRPIEPTATAPTGSTTTPTSPESSS